jgi:hypothetical protein
VDFIDIGFSVKVRQEPYRVLLSDLDLTEIEMLAYKLRSAGLKGERVQGTALRQMSFPGKLYRQWHIVYLVIPQLPKREIFIISISPKKLDLAGEAEEAAKINKKIRQIVFAALRLLSSWL